MAGFFYLGGGGRDGSTSNNNNNNNKHEKDQDRNSGYLCLYKDEIYNNNNNNNNNNRSFEIWPPQYFQEQHHQETGSSSFFSFGMLPNNTNNNYHNRSRGLFFNVVRDEEPLGSGGGFTVMGSSRQSGMNCQDCGNQAKKDCPHLRCRTCCKSRGFQCQTHVKSTWVPAAKRRERQAQLASIQQHGEDHVVKRLREENANSAVGGDNLDDGGSALACSNAIIRVQNAPSSGMEMSNYPAEVCSTTTFRCVRVSAMDDADQEYAYQTAVNIGGHLFRGILYDQGPENLHQSTNTAGETSQQQNLLTAAVTSAGGNNSGVDPSLIYTTPLNAFMAGTQFFPPPRP